MSEICIYNRLLNFLSDLEEQNIAYTLAHSRPEAIMVTIATPGDRWEVEFLDDGSVDVERFRSTGSLRGEDAIAEIMKIMT